MPLFTIVTVSKNNRQGLKATAESIGEQEFRDFQWIIIDSVSNDGTGDDLESYPATLLCEPDDGPYDGMNKGIELAIGDYLIFMNSGDRFAQTQTLQKVRDAIWFSQPDFIYGDSWETDGNRTAYKPARSYLKIDKGMFTHHQSMFYKRALIRELRYDTNYKIAADYDFTIAFLNRAQTCLYLPQPICVFRSGGLSQKNVTLGRNEQFAIRQKQKVTSFPKNALTYAMQTVSWGFRACAPGLYWTIRRTTAGNTNPPSEPSDQT